MPSTSSPSFSVPAVGPARCVQALNCELGEGLLWSVREQALYWVDILARQLHRWEPASHALRRWTFAEEISALAERVQAPGLIVALRRGFALFDPAADTEPRYLHQPEPERTGNRFNDGKCDAQGRLWIAHWGGACVTCHDPLTARELARVALPASQVTNCAFGGPDLRTLFITTARTGLTPQQLAAEPLAGSLFAVSVDSPGLPAALFGG